MDHNILSSTLVIIADVHVRTWHWWKKWMVGLERLPLINVLWLEHKTEVSVVLDWNNRAPKFLQTSGTSLNLSELIASLETRIAVNSTLYTVRTAETRCAKSAVSRASNPQNYSSLPTYRLSKDELGLVPP